jgi:CRP-like cAMP-binding protein
MNRNVVLRMLPHAEATRLGKMLEPVDMPLRMNIERPREAARSFYFVDSGIVSVVATVGGTRNCEVGLIGREGGTGLSTILGIEGSPHDTMVQSPATGRRIEVAALREAMESMPVLRSLLLRYVHCFLVQASSTALANAKGTLPERLARWLLMANDRIGGDEVRLTHEFVSVMLAVRRATVTQTLHVLEGEGMIKSTRGSVRLLDRKKMIAASKNLYGAPEAEYRRVMGAEGAASTVAPAVPA